MTLNQGTIGKTYIVEDIHVAENTERRLEALGLFKGTPVDLLNKKKSGTAIFKVRGTRLAVGPEISSGIIINGGGQHESDNK